MPTTHKQQTFARAWGLAQPREAVEGDGTSQTFVNVKKKKKKKMMMMNIQCRRRHRRYQHRPQF